MARNSVASWDDSLVDNSVALWDYNLAVVEMVVLKERELVERKVGHLDVFLAEKTVECLTV